MRNVLFSQVEASSNPRSSMNGPVKSLPCIALILPSGVVGPEGLIFSNIPWQAPGKLAVSPWNLLFPCLYHIDLVDEMVAPKDMNHSEGRTHHSPQALPPSHLIHKHEMTSQGKPGTHGIG
ncbi:hypothetical protein H671_8g19004 [Cricetulus griseus]|nr:hypothetical protein H671_8g19004 [Cricetulus griseus]